MAEAATMRYHVHPEAAHRLVGGEVFVVTADRAFHRLHTPTAIDLFQRLAAGPVSAAELVSFLTARYAVSSTDAAGDVAAFLGTLLERRLATTAAAATETASPTARASAADAAK